jgi:diguanylate cyclase (GGDEF)-like protein/PAS domain S-box-containing protein
VLNVTRIIPAPGGGFGGLVTASLDPDYFSILLQSVLYAPDMRAGIAHGDGVQFMMSPDNGGEPGRNLAVPGSFFSRHRQGGRQESVMTGTVPGTTEERMVAQGTVFSRRMQMDKPLVIAVSRNINAIYARWRSESLMTGCFFVLLNLLLAIGLGYHQARQRNLEESARQAETLQRMRLHLLDFAIAHPMEEVLQETLDQVGALTGSPVGFYHVVAPDRKTLTLQTWSTRTLTEFCGVTGQSGHENVERAGLWADCIHRRCPVIHNDYASQPHRTGLPDGHPPLARQLTVPVLRGGGVVAVMGVGNKADEYTPADVELVSYVADIIWEVLERLRAEKRLRQRVSELSALNAMGTIISSAADPDDIFRLVLDEALSLMGVDAAGMYLLDRETGEMSLVAHRGVSEAFAQGAARIRPGEGLAGTAARTGAAVVVNSPEAFPASLRDALRAEHVGSCVAIPLKGSTGVLGVMSLASRAENSFDDGKVALLENMGNQISTGLEKARLFQSVQDALEFNWLILDTSFIGVITYDETGNCVSANRISGQLIGVTREHILQENFRNLSWWRASGLLDAAETVLKQGGYRTMDVRRSLAGGRDAWINCHLARFWVGGKPHLLLMTNDITERKQLEETLSRQARIDFLTGIYNRQMFNELAAVEMQRSRRYGAPLSLVMFDLDRFKEINDRHGHATGDHVLRETAALVAANIRAQDIFARWGGEEFMLLCPSSDLPQAAILAEKLRGLVERCHFGEGLTVTASFGVTRFLEEDTVESFSSRADERLYLAKKNGRNRVEAEGVSP